MNDLVPFIDAYLLSRGGWVKARELCERFGVNERQLRANDDQPGLCSRIAISGNRGFKHIAVATAVEWDEHYGRERKHNIMALVNLRAKRRLRISMTRKLRRPTIIVERDTGQMLMSGLIDGPSDFKNKGGAAQPRTEVPENKPREDPPQPKDVTSISHLARATLQQALSNAPAS